MPRPHDSPVPQPSPGFVLVGRVLRPFGVRGELKVESLTDFPERFAPGSVLHLNGKPRTVEGSRPLGQNIAVKFAGIENPEDGSAFAGAVLEVSEASLCPLAPGVYYHSHLIGLRVTTTTGETLGALTRIISAAGNDIYVVEGPRGEILVPAISAVVQHIDLATGVMTINVIPGLL